MTIETHQMMASPRNGSECPSPVEPSPKRAPRRKKKVKEVDQNQSNDVEQPGGDQLNYILEFAKGVMVETTNLSVAVAQSPPPSSSASIASSVNNGIKDGSLSPSTSSISTSSGIGDSSSSKESSYFPLNPTKRVKAKRKRSVDDSSLESAGTSVACRKSKRLLFKHTRLNNASKNILPSNSDSISPYGRVVELINPQQEMNRCDLMTKVLFLGNLDLTPRDSNSVSLKDVGGDSETGASSKDSNPKISKASPKNKGFVVTSLQKLCIQSIVKRMKHQFDQQEVEYFSRPRGTSDGSDSDDSGIWMKISEFVNQPTQSARPKDFEADLEDCVDKLFRCGTKVRFAVPLSSSSSTRVQEISSNGAVEQEKGEWFNWVDQFIPDENHKSNNADKSKRPGRSICKPRKATNDKRTI